METKNEKKNTEIKNEKKTEKEKPENDVKNLDENDLKDVSGGIPTPIILVPLFPDKNKMTTMRKIRKIFLLKKPPKEFSLKRLFSGYCRNSLPSCTRRNPAGLMPFVNAGIRTPTVAYIPQKV